MIHLRTLGSVQLDSPRRPAAGQLSSQPKRLALLAYLALARPRGAHRRDTLLALLWPEATQERGRQTLRQTLHLLRQALGPDVFAARSDEDVAIDDTRLATDVARFEAALDAGRFAEALEQYGGDFLHGFHVPGASQEFEDWVAEERRRLRSRAASAARTLASQEERAGSASGAVHWARRAIQLDPDNEEAVRDLMRLHARLGDRASALLAFDEHARRMRRDYDAEPQAELSRLAGELKAAGATTLPTPPREQPSAPASAPPSVPPSVPARRPGFDRRIWIGVAAVVLLLGVGAAWRLRATPDRARLIAVGSIVQVVGPDSTVESAVASDLLATSLARLRGIDVIPAVRLYDVESQLRAVSGGSGLLDAARYIGASHVLRGTLRRLDDGRMTLDGQLLDLSSGAVIHAFHADGANLFELVDDATGTLAATLGVAPPPLPIREVTTRSLVAYRLYQEGLQKLYGESDVHLAYGLFKSAMTDDSTFAMAAYYGHVAAGIMGLPEAQPLASLADRLAAGAPDRERLTIRYRLANLAQAPEAVALAETLSVRFPNDLDAIYARGNLLLRSGDWSGAAAQFRRVVELDSLSLHMSSVRCVACDAYAELWWTWVYADSMGRAEAVAREVLRRQGVHTPFLDLLAVSQARQNRFADARRSWYTLYDSLTTPVGGSLLQQAWLAIRSGDLTDAEVLLAGLRQTGPPPSRGEYDWYRAIVLRNQGRPAAAIDLSPDARGVALCEAGRYRDGAALFDAAARQIVRDQPRSLPKQLAWQLTHVATCLAGAGDTARLARLADSIQAIGARSSYGRDVPLHHYTRGLLWLARGDTSRAAEEFRSSIWSWSDGYTRANYELARALIALGRAREAIYPLQAALRGDLQSSNLYVTRTELREQLARAFAATGARDSARAEYGLVRRAWAQAEPAFLQRRAAAEAYLAK